MVRYLEFERKRSFRLKFRVFLGWQKLRLATQCFHSNISKNLANGINQIFYYLKSNMLLCKRQVKYEGVKTLLHKSIFFKNLRYLSSYSKLHRINSKAAFGKLYFSAVKKAFTGLLLNLSNNKGFDAIASIRKVPFSKESFSSNPQLMQKIDYVSSNIQLLNNVQV